ncbi:putative lipid II flippase FtsW [Spelaeicoccus albus]|uniref:putative lipid II flippase FtsW n=1 Tax=Spelaeicoccus albus TaxID=1280376 RepID=UPI001F011282|nr:putative lipid II flippase FtsW [Spelaeicoccus albus]
MVDIAPRQKPGRQGDGRRRSGLADWFHAPTTSYYLIIGSTVALTVFGLVMVLSSSSVDSYDGGQGSSYSVFDRQAIFAAVGVVLMIVASHVPLSVWKKMSWGLIALAVVAQLLPFVPGVGISENGNNAWIHIGSFTAQPSEAGKVALVLWLGVVLGAKHKLLGQWRHVFIPVVPVVAILLGLILLSGDLGTGMIFMVLVLGALYAAGVPLRMFGVAGIGLAIIAGAMLVSSPNRMARATNWLSGGGTSDPLGGSYQSTHGLWALASGGFWGEGLGASRQKWDYLPEAHNDFIYAIIGEELGLPGTIGLLIVFALLAIGLLRVIKRTPDMCVKIVTSGVFAWILGQAILNIAVVLGLLPVVGVPLPLVSSGGSAVLTTLLGLGIVLSFARNEPGAAAAMSRRNKRIRGSLAVLARPRTNGRNGR